MAFVTPVVEHWVEREIEPLTIPQHKNHIGCWVSNKGIYEKSYHT